MPIRLCQIFLMVRTHSTFHILRQPVIQVRRKKEQNEKRGSEMRCHGCPSSFFIVLLEATLDRALFVIQAMTR